MKPLTDRFRRDLTEAKSGANRAGYPDLPLRNSRCWQVNPDPNEDAHQAPRRCAGRILSTKLNSLSGASYLLADVWIGPMRSRKKSQRSGQRSGSHQRVQALASYEQLCCFVSGGSVPRL